MKTLRTPKEQIIALLEQLSLPDQERVLSFIQSFSGEPEGLSGQELVDFFSQFSFTQEEADEMSGIYEELGK